MFRLAFISYIALRVIACPIFCIGGADTAMAAEIEQVGECHCGHQQSTPCDGNELPPSNCPCPCDDGCAIQITPELNSHTVSADLLLSLDVAPLCLETLDFAAFLGKRCGERHLHRFYLQSGRDVRLAYASLLL